MKSRYYDGLSKFGASLYQEYLEWSKYDLKTNLRKYMELVKEKALALYTEVVEFCKFYTYFLSACIIAKNYRDFLIYCFHT